VRTYYPDQITADFAVELPFKQSPDNKWAFLKWAFLLEVLSTWSAGRMIGHPLNRLSTAIVSALPALEYLPCKWLSLTAGVQVPICGKNTQYNYSPTLALFINF
jgi:hypothetical protein